LEQLMPPTPTAFFRGEVVPLEQAKIGVMTHALHYGTAVFEGIRGNWNADDQTFYLFVPGTQRWPERQDHAWASLPDER
jgi:hypothetical protein